MQLPRQREAGRSADRKAGELRRKWRRRAPVKTVRLTFLTLAITGILLAYSPLPVNLRVPIAAAAGGLMALYIALGDMSSSADRYARGAEGERRTERALKELRGEGWVVRHDLAGSNGNVDHVAIGPPGVFLLDSKAWSGTLAVTDGVPTVSPWDEPERIWTAADVPGRLKWEAKEHHDYLVAGSTVNPWVQAVVVFWGDFAQRSVEADRVSYVHGDGLVEWLRDRKPRYSRAEVQELAVALAQVPRFEDVAAEEGSAPKRP